MLSPGKHSTRDIPRMVAEISAAHPGIPVQVTTAFGVNEQLASVVLSRAGVSPVACAEPQQLRASRGHAGALLWRRLRRGRVHQ